MVRQCLLNVTLGMDPLVKQFFIELKLSYKTLGKKACIRVLL
jgi:hypothetical protein